jgi:hypothetical protein
VIVGESIGSPAATARTADDVGRRRVLEQEAAGAGAQGAQDIIVGLEGGEDDDLGCLGPRAQQLGGGQALHPRRADVHQHDVGPVLGHRLCDLAAVRGLGDDRDVVGACEQHGQPGANQRVVVDDEHADPLAHFGHGNHARSRKLPCPSSPCSRWPPESVARSAKPTSPVPDPGISGSPAARTAAGLRVRRTWSWPVTCTVVPTR